MRIRARGDLGLQVKMAKRIVSSGIFLQTQDRGHTCPNESPEGSRLGREASQAFLAKWLFSGALLSKGALWYLYNKNPPTHFCRLAGASFGPFFGLVCQGRLLK